MTTGMFELLPDPDCNLCPRLHCFRQQARAEYPDQYNSPVPSFGPKNAQLLIVGLAPGLKGANFTGRPFTGDYAGELLYGTLLKYGFATGEFKARKDDGLELINARITNAVKCVPPENKPTGDEINTCLQFLTREIETMPNIKVILSLGLISHNSVLKAIGQKISKFKFEHNVIHDIGGGRKLIDSYHCSRYNTNTGRLTTEMFEAVFNSIQSTLK